MIASYRIRPGVDSTLLRLLLFSALEGHELSEMFFGKHHKVFYDHLAAYIRTRIKDGAFRPVDPSWPPARSSAWSSITVCSMRSSVSRCINAMSTR